MFCLFTTPTFMNIDFESSQQQDINKPQTWMKKWGGLF